MGSVSSKFVIQLRHKLSCSDIEDCHRLEILNLESRGVELSIQQKQGSCALNGSKKLSFSFFFFFFVLLKFKV